MADCSISSVKEIGKACLWFIKGHFDYWWCFDNNIRGLEDEVGELNPQICDLKQKIEEARHRLEVVSPGVEKWLKASTEKLAEARLILDNIPKACNLISRYSLGKKANKTAPEIAELRNYGNFNIIVKPRSPPDMGFPSHRSTMEFGSRKRIEESIIDSLKKSSVDLIEICGMGGVGKTTMAQRIGKRLKEENLFDEVVMVTVTQNTDMLKIQNEIAELLSLKFDVESLSARAYQLRTRLMDTKRKIIILDDVWATLLFEDLGIPIDNNFERCKVLLTSRVRDTCRRIKSKVVFQLEVLGEEEAWILFMDKAGTCVEDSAIRHLARYVVAECRGLPLALVIVGMALRDQMEIYMWIDALSQLKKIEVAYVKYHVKFIYPFVKLNYDFLENEYERCFFLLCSFFPRDYDIPMDRLTWYSMGLGLFNDITNIEEARNVTHRLVGKLKSRFLLIDSKNMLHVKMHDVVRDVAICICSEEKTGFLKSLHSTSIENSNDVSCNWLSVDISNERMEVPVLSRFPKLRLLMLQESKWSSNELSDISFAVMKELNVLSFESVSIGSLPPTLGSLENLQTFCLVNCEVENISVIAKLTSLKILSCYGCANIKELPAEIKGLKWLRLLELSGCKRLKKIPFGSIKSLFLLEELKIRGSFSAWEAEENGKERGNASLTELGSLPNLTCLEIEIDNYTLCAQKICLSQNLVKYYIRIGSDDYHYEERDYQKVMILNLPSDTGAVGEWIPRLAKDAESLSLRGDGSDNINLAEMENLRNLEFTNCSTVKKLVEAGRCPLQLEVLEIKNCDAMEEVLWNKDMDNNTDGCIVFPELKKLRLVDLPNLTAFWQGPVNIVDFPNLSEMTIRNVPNLKFGTRLRFN